MILCIKGVVMKIILIIFMALVLLSCERNNKNIMEINVENIIVEKQDIIPENNARVIEEITYEMILERMIFDTSIIETPNIFENLSINILNGEITTNYNVPDIINIHTGSGDGYWPRSLDYTGSYFVRFLENIRIFFHRDTDINKRKTIVAIGGTNEFEMELPPLNRLPNLSDNDIYGYYVEVPFESKPWLNNSDNPNKWQIIVRSDDEELINEDLVINFTHIFFNRLNQTPFIVNHLRLANFNNEYTYRVRTMDFDVLVFYLNIEYFAPSYGSIYRPILYFLINDINEIFTDINISWNGEPHRRLFHIGRYKINELPTAVRVFPVFDTIVVR
jgi:hypothetical protein